MTSDLELSMRLRDSASDLDRQRENVVAEHAQHLLRLAANRLEACEQALRDIAGWENWQTPTWREIAQAALPREAAKRERLEHEAVAPEIVCDASSGTCAFAEWCSTHESCWASEPYRETALPMIPMYWEYGYDTPERERYQRDMVAWVRAVTAGERKDREV